MLYDGYWICFLLSLHQASVYGRSQAALQNVQHDAEVAAPRNLQLWLPDVPEHGGWTLLQWPQPVPHLSLGHRQLWL